MKIKKIREIEIFNYLKPVLKISIVMTLVFIFMVFYYKYWSVFIIYLSFGIGSIPLILIGIGCYKIFKYYYKNLKISQYILAIIFSIFFCVLFIKSYIKIAETPLGANLLSPLICKKVEEHFEKNYGKEYQVTGIRYYLDRGDAGHSGGWYKKVNGYIKGTEENIVVYMEDYITENYGRLDLYRKTYEYYDNLLKEVIPWEFKLYLESDFPYSFQYRKSYEEVLENKDKNSIKKLGFTITSSRDILENYTREEIREIFFKIIKIIYERINYLEESSLITLTFKDIPLSALKELSQKDAFELTSTFSLHIKTEHLDYSIMEIKSHHQFEKKLKNEGLNWNGEY